MSTDLFQHALLGLVRLLTTAAATGWVSSPMSWSPDSRWLAYASAPEPARAAVGLLDPSPAAGADVEAPAAVGGMYRIWASRRDGSASVVVEEASTPMTSPRWSPRGRSMAFGRFVPEAGAPARGRLEVVIRDGLDRRRVLLAVPGVELDGPSGAHLADLAPAWSPDGQFLAFPTPGHDPTILVIRVDSRRAVQTIERGLLPSWSPDGSRLAFLRREDAESYSLQLVERSGQSLSGPRELRRIGGIAAPIGWAADGRSILAVLERARLQPDVDLARVAIDDPAPAPDSLHLVPGVLRRGPAAIRGLAIDYGRNNEEMCFFSADLAGRESDVCWSVPRDHLMYKRFVPLDQSIPVVGLSIAPDGRALAMRFGSGEAPSPPAVVELETENTPPTERTTLIVADESARRGWLGLLGRAARSLLAIATPPIAIDGRPIARPTVLPLPGEAADVAPIRSRFARLGRFGASIAGQGGEPGSRRDREERLFFDYLKGDYAAAIGDLEALEAFEATRDRRLSLLALRAQILWASGDGEGARAVADYLVEAVGGPVYRVEETPIGRTLVPEPDAAHGRDWARYLAARAGRPLPDSNFRAAAGAFPTDRDDNRLVDPFAPNPPPGIDFPRERGVGDALPFVPELPDPNRDFQAQRRALRRLLELRQGQPPR